MTPSSRSAPAALPWIVFLTALTAVGPLSTDLYLPAMPAMGAAFAVSVAEVQATLSVYMVGFAASQLVAGPLSDRFGRRPVMLGGLALYLAAGTVCLFAPEIGILIAGRFFQALGACCGAVLARAVVRDLYEPEDSVRIMAALGAAMAIAPAIGPVLGGWILVRFGWKAEFAVMVGFAAAILAVTFSWLRETNSFRGQASLSPRAILGNFAVLARDRRFLAYALTMGLVFGGMFAFISGSPFVIIGILKVPPQRFGFAFVCMVTGLLTGSLAATRLTRILRPDEMIRIGLAVSCTAAAAMAGCAALGIQTLPAILAPIAGYTLGMGLVMPACMAAAIGPFPRIAGAASSLLGFGQGLAAAASGWVVGLAHDGTTRGLAFTLAGCVVLAALSFLVLSRRR